MQIQVIYPDGSKGFADSYALDNLIEQKEIIAFERSGGWAWIARDPLRKRKRRLEDIEQQPKETY